VYTHFNRANVSGLLGAAGIVDADGYQRLADQISEHTRVSAGRVAVWASGGRQPAAAACPARRPRRRPVRGPRPHRPADPAAGAVVP